MNDERQSLSTKVPLFTLHLNREILRNTGELKFQLFRGI